MQSYSSCSSVALRSASVVGIVPVRQFPDKNNSKTEAKLNKCVGMGPAKKNGKKDSQKNESTR